ncbi:hypothetical protein B0H15DRAFT_827409 [Mycena belliarum]|uniref:Uncharacterized protein n=1 Tax=Mycena belliarum TaxID=1033014 RepID=A0AAD6UC99_9AGAR|nr:hypothetical protein B0H15DRAFT_827409 [Mycena belliae]
MADLHSCPSEVLQLVFYDLDNPTAFTRTNRRLYAFSQDPYIRAHYFLARYGPLQALYFALARGKLITPRVLDILLASGAHLSRYLVQVAFHHFFHSQSHFLKPAASWVRHVPLTTFSYFLNLAAERYGDIPRAKGEDDGALFATFIKEAKLPPESQRVSWETIRDIFENYHFIPFCTKDPLMASFPLALAIEPRLLPYAVANGFQMDAKYRDFVFRKMFERMPAPKQAHAEEIVANVRELCRLDPDMFVTRTVAAEVCLEVKTNEAAYIALKQLDRAGDLPFSLVELVQDLIKLFHNVRAITTSATSQVLTQLYTDFLAPPPLPIACIASRNALSSPRPQPVVDPIVRRTMLLTIFAAEPPVPATALAARLAPLRLGPLTLADAADILLSAFVEKQDLILSYLRKEGVAVEPGASRSSYNGKEGMRKVTLAEYRMFAEEVAVRCLTRESKGKTIKRLCETYPSVKCRIVEAVLGEHEVPLEALGEGSGSTWRARLARSMFMCDGGGVSDAEEDDHDHEGEEDDELDDDSESEPEMWSGVAGTSAVATESKPDRDLGTIGFEALSTMIRRDELQGGRGGRRRYYPAIYGATGTNSSRLPLEMHSVARWIKTEFGANSRVTATFFTHAIINGNTSVLSNYLMPTPASVPITLRHFEVMARLGSSSMDYQLYDRIKQGAPFYTTEDEYLAGADSARLMLKRLGKGKQRETGSPPCVKVEPVDLVSVGSPRGKKRPRRSAAVTAVNYAVPDSDDDAIAAEEDREDEFAEYRTGGVPRKKVAKVETSLERWVEALGKLLKEEQHKYREKKKRMEKESKAAGGVKVRVSKSDFFRSLSGNMRLLRELDVRERMFRIAAGEVTFSDEDDEYVQSKAPRAKRRRTA